MLDVDVTKACKTIVDPAAPMALRLQGNLLYATLFSCRQSRLMGVGTEYPVYTYSSADMFLLMHRMHTTPWWSCFVR